MIVHSGSIQDPILGDPLFWDHDLEEIIMSVNAALTGQESKQFERTEVEAIVYISALKGLTLTYVFSL